VHTTAALVTSISTLSLRRRTLDHSSFFRSGPAVRKKEFVPHKPGYRLRQLHLAATDRNSPSPKDPTWSLVLFLEHELWHCTATVLLHMMRTSPCPPIGFQAPNYVRPNLPLAPANAALLVTVKHYCITNNGFYDACLPNSFQGQCRAGRRAVKWTADVAPGYSESWEYCLRWPGCEAYPVR
jgi:hypothetical protein